MLCQARYSIFFYIYLELKRQKGIQKFQKDKRNISFFVSKPKLQCIVD